MSERRGPALTDELTTPRLVVRAFRPDDAEALYATVADSREHIARWLLWTDQHGSVADSRAFIEQAREQWQQAQDFTFGVFARDSGALLGGLGLHPRAWNVPFFEVGYWLAASAEGNGYMTEAASALVDYAIRDLGALRVEIHCDALNTRSAAVARRLGFTQEALFRKHMRRPDGRLRDTLVFAKVV